jgi:hypothetical protein
LNAIIIDLLVLKIFSVHWLTGRITLSAWCSAGSGSRHLLGQTGPSLQSFGPMQLRLGVTEVPLIVPGVTCVTGVTANVNFILREKTHIVHLPHVGFSYAEKEMP